MSKQIREKIQQANQAVKNWPKTGWKTTFGPKSTEVNSQKDASALPKGFPYRSEAVAYWDNVIILSQDIVVYLEKALAAFDKNDLAAVDDFLYYARYLAKPFENSIDTCTSVYDEFKKSLV